MNAILDIFWMQDDSVEDADHLSAPEVITSDTIKGVQAAIAQLADTAGSPAGAQEG